MGAPIYRGSAIPYLQKEWFDFDPTRGYIVYATYRGLSQTQMNLLQASYSNAGIANRLVFEQGDTATLEIEDATNVNTIDNWQLVGDDDSKDLMSHPLLAFGLTDDQAAAFRTHLANDDSATLTFATAPPTDVADLRSFAGTVVERMYGIYLKGGNEFRNAKYVLRHSTNVSNRWTVNISDFGVEEIYTTAQLLSEISNSGLWIFPCPNRLQYKLSTIPAPTPVANYRWGWLKSPSTETTSAHNRVEITTEYRLEQFSTDIYTPH